MRRTVLLFPHGGRQSNLDAAERATDVLNEAGVEVRMVSLDNPAVFEEHPKLRHVPRMDCEVENMDGVELVLVLGGDGTFLRGAHIAHKADLPVLGINLGHVGFLAEWDADSLEAALHRVIDRDYHIEERMTIEAAAYGPDGGLIARGWALNEVSVENTNRGGVLDAILEIDSRPVSSFGCDGVLVSTPTGSTAYAFSAGGPILWPELDAILVVPNNAHALFTKPLVISPDSTVAIESRRHAAAARAVLDGFVTMELPAGSRVEVKRGRRPVRWVRLDNKPFTDRLVTKFRLPVEGWRGPRKMA